MFSSKFLSGANPLNAVSSAVNKFGLFGDDGDGDKNQKAPSQQGVKTPVGQQHGAGPGKGPHQQQGPQKPDQGPSMQKSQPLPKQPPPQLHEKNGQAGALSKPGGQQAVPKTGTQPEGQVKGQLQKNQTQSSPKPGAQQQILTKSGVHPESPKPPSQQQVTAKTGMQKQGPASTGAQQQEPVKTGAEESPKVGSQKTGSQQGSPKVGQQQQGGARTGQQQQGSPKPSQQQQGPSKAGQQGFKTAPQQAAGKAGPQRLAGPQGPGAPGLTRKGSLSAGTTKAGSQAKAADKPLCPVCKTTELNTNTKEPPNHKICTQCKNKVCGLCGFSPPDSDVSSCSTFFLIFCLHVHAFYVVYTKY